MVAPKINMHGKIYDLYDEIDRSQVEAKKKLAEIHGEGLRAFLNPRKRKDQETTYYIYTAKPTPRKPRESKLKEVEVEKPKDVPKVATKTVGKKANRKKANGKKTSKK